MKTLILGGARSGKSRYAQQLAEQSGRPVIYVATATAGDEEMRRRIEQHQRERPDHWQLVEEPRELVALLERYSEQQVCLLVDCLTLWLSNELAEAAEAGHAEQVEARVVARVDALVEAVAGYGSELLLVSNEVGQGVVPMGELSRRFVDEAGRMHQKLAQVCERVVMTVAGLPQVLKSEG